MRTNASIQWKRWKKKSRRREGKRQSIARKSWQARKRERVEETRGKEDYYSWGPPPHGLPPRRQSVVSQRWTAARSISRSTNDGSHHFHLHLLLHLRFFSLYLAHVLALYPCILPLALSLSLSPCLSLTLSLTLTLSQHHFISLFIDIYPFVPSPPYLHLSRYFTSSYSLSFSPFIPLFHPYAFNWSPRYTRTSTHIDAIAYRFLSPFLLLFSPFSSVERAFASSVRTNVSTYGGVSCTRPEWMQGVVARHTSRS